MTPARAASTVSGVRTLVTGGAGFIGSNLVDALLARGDEVAVLDDLSTGRRENLAGALEAGATLHDGSVADAGAVAAAFAAARPEVVYHLAAQIDVRRAVEDPALDAHDQRRRARPRCSRRRAGPASRRFVLASTGGAIYGDAGGRARRRRAEPRRPLSPYAASKAAAESYMRALPRGCTGSRPFSLRLANVYGPRQDPRGEAGVIAIYCGRAATGAAPPCTATGCQTRDFVFVGDVVEALHRGRRQRRRRLLQRRDGARDQRARARARRSASSAVRAGAGGRGAALVPEPRRRRRIIGWRARTSLRAGLERTVDSARAAEPGDVAPARLAA